MKLFLIIITTALISSVGTYHFFQPAVDASTPVSSCETSDANLVGVKSADEITKHIQIADDLEQTQPIPGTIIHDITISKQSPESNHSEVSKSAKPVKDAEDQIAAFRSQLDKIKDASPLEFIQNRYASEPLNYEWAVNKESAILSLFDTSENLHTFKPLDISCKSKNCQIILAAGDQQQTDFMYGAMLKAVTAHQDSPNQTVSYFSDPAAGQMIIYVSQDGVMDLVQ